MSNHPNRKKVANRVPLKADVSSKLHDAVATWLNQKGVDYDDGARGAYQDLRYGGCSSGIVNSLIYTGDCEAFAKRYLIEILEVMTEYHDNISDVPLPQGEPITATWLAWFGFEQMAHTIAQEMGWNE